jgi:hypothetical protein
MVTGRLIMMGIDALENHGLYSAHSFSVYTHDDEMTEFLAREIHPRSRAAWKMNGDRRTWRE